MYRKDIYLSFFFSNRVEVEEWEDFPELTGADFISIFNGNDMQKRIEGNYNVKIEITGHLRLYGVFGNRRKALAQLQKMKPNLLRDLSNSTTETLSPLLFDFKYLLGYAKKGAHFASLVKKSGVIKFNNKRRYVIGDKASITRFKLSLLRLQDTEKKVLGSRSIHCTSYDPYAIVKLQKSDVDSFSKMESDSSVRDVPQSLSLSKALKSALKQQGEKQNCFVYPMIRVGSMESLLKPGEYSMKDIFTDEKDRNLVLKSLSQPIIPDMQHVDECFKEIWRYDFTIASPLPTCFIRYKVFIGKNASNGKYQFVDNVEGGEESVFYDARAGPGYFSWNTKNVARFDLVNASDGKTCRLAIQIHYDSDVYYDKLRRHLNVLNSTFFEMIKLGDGINLDMPTLPSPFIMFYVRRGKRAFYRIKGSPTQTLQITSEEVLLNLEGREGENNRFYDAFIKDTSLISMMNQPNWNVNNVEEQLKDLLKKMQLIVH